MPGYNFNLPEIVRQAFGVSGVILSRPTQESAGRFAYMAVTPNEAVAQNVIGRFAKYGAIQTFPDTPKDAYSLLGTPIYMPVAFDAAEWDSRDEDGVFEKHSTTSLVMPPATLIDFSRNKKIVRTEISGRDGTVKEYIGADDWQVRIRSVLINEENPMERPEQLIRDLRRLESAPVSIPIVNDMCTWLGIYNIVIERIDLQSLEGYPGVVPCVIDCSSDAAFEVKYKNGL